ncbi:4-oxalocrotonate tautomerase family protein [Salinarchaeum sp. IM2453]|uniref:tautomerase family protein n=1 Tax=Salinarchaeum sp. IM2453 TaxID=2862870 RepID=UPI001C82B513|nr:tautomerase family protein [Salinarchaeum sp. IM2453]QZA88623.1 4-oxalocrotonate tautomerase family protein [Salinarchaeum sp. IM2453]
MPLLKFDTTLTLSDQDRNTFSDQVTTLYTDKMSTTAGHVAVVIREHQQTALSLGRSVDGSLLFLDADIREGRPLDQKREFALAVMELAEQQLGLPEENMKVVFTEHEGEMMMGKHRIGTAWSANDNE